MDATLNDFLNEINEIAPLNTTKEYLWEECYDEASGYYYYWNTKTDQVTWEAPIEYKALKLNTKKIGSAGTSLYVPPRTAPLFPSTGLPQMIEPIKIYKISDNLPTTSQQKINENQKTERTKTEEKVVLTSYGDDTDSEEEIIEKINDVINEPSKTESNEVPESDKIQSASLALVAGYSDSSSDTEETNEKTSYSTLFPITKPINLDDFYQKTKPEIPEIEPEKSNDFDRKAFQRKKRIGVALMNTIKKTKIDDNKEDVVEKSDYTKAFVKGDTLNPTKDETVIRVPKDINESYETLKEKLSFLCEGREMVLPVQSMLIQLETLFEALKSGDLKALYLSKWLNETCSNLIKLEKEATPEGWLLQWDRSHKRYYYENEITGESQWEYPQPDVMRRDDAMDISTTPPPPPTSTNENPHLSSPSEEQPPPPPLPPTTRTPTPPPPPPTCSDSPNKRTVKSDGNEDDEPLPPGVDQNEPVAIIPDNLKNELDSFYSDIAAIETTNSPSSSINDEEKSPDLKMNSSENSNDFTKKKKKTKVTLTKGIAMKKKGVSKMVEKWKNVQMSYKD